MKTLRKPFATVLAVFLTLAAVLAPGGAHGAQRIKDLAVLSGVRSNQLVGIVRRRFGSKRWSARPNMGLTALGRTSAWIGIVVGFSDITSLLTTSLHTSPHQM